MKCNGYYFEFCIFFHLVSNFQIILLNFFFHGHLIFYFQMLSTPIDRYSEKIADYKQQFHEDPNKYNLLLEIENLNNYLNRFDYECNQDIQNGKVPTIKKNEKSEIGSKQKTINFIKKYIQKLSEEKKNNYFLHYHLLKKIIKEEKIKLQQIMLLLRSILKDNLRGAERSNYDLKLAFAAIYFDPLIYLMDNSTYKTIKSNQFLCKKYNCSFLIKANTSKEEVFTLLDGSQITIPKFTDEQFIPNVKPKKVNTTKGIETENDSGQSTIPNDDPFNVFREDDSGQTTQFPLSSEQTIFPDHTIFDDYNEEDSYEYFNLF